MSRSSDVRSLVRGGPEPAADAIDALFAGLVERLAKATPGALAGAEGDVATFVSAYRALVGEMLGSIHEVEPHLVELDRDRPILVDSEGKAAPVAMEILRQSALQAPFSPWVEKFGPGLGAALHLASEIRTFLPGHQPLRLPREWATFPHVEVSQDQFIRFAKRVWSELEELRQSQLEAIMDSFGVNKTELARLFGVRRQAVDQWLSAGVPPNRQEKVAAVLAISDLLMNKLKVGRVPGVVRRPSAAFEGRSILECISSNRHLDVLDTLHETFDWAATA